MKRVLVFAAAVWACTGVPPAIDGGTSGGGTAGAGGSSGGGVAGSGGSSGGSTAGGSATAGGSGGCTTACNCAPGFSCFNAECIAGTVPVYCCTERPCPAGDFCQEPGGPFDRCPTPDGGRFDAGDRTDAGRFDGGGGRPDGGRIDGGRIDGGCGTACDCAPPQGCSNGRCISSPTPIYCCKGTFCPAKEVCQDPAGGYGQCGSDGGGPFDAGRPDAGRKQCNTACDCAPGLSCVSGTCLAAFVPVYCCGSAVCPMGNQCESDGGVFGLCP